MNPIGNTTGKSCDTDLRQSQNRQGMLADLRPSSPSPPRVAAVAPQPCQRSKRPLSAMHPALPGGAGQAPSRQEDPWHELSREHMGQTMAFGGERASVFDSLMNRLLSDDHEAYDPENPDVRALMADYEATLQDAGAAPPTVPAQEHPPEGGSPVPGRATGQTEATLPGGALETPSGRAAMASGDQRADVFEAVMNRLLSDDYEAYDPEEPNVRALIADYSAALQDAGLDAGAAPPTVPAQEHPSVGEGPGPGRATGQTEAALPGEALETPSGRAAMASGGQSADVFEAVMNRLLSDDYEAYDPEEPNVRALMADYSAALLDAGAGPSSAPAFGQKSPPGGRMLVTADQRQAILHIFKTNPKKSSRSIADEIGVSLSTIKSFRRKFRKTGNIKAGDRANRLTADQHRAILHIFKTDPKKSNRSIADEIGVTDQTIQALRKKFGKTGDIKAKDRISRLSDGQRRAILQIFETDPERSTQSIKDEIGVSHSTIKRLRLKFRKTGNIKTGDHTNRLTDGQRQAIMHIFETDPERSSQSIADEFGVSSFTIAVSKRRFGRIGNIDSRDVTNRLTGDQRRAILEIFRTDGKRSHESIADEINVSLSTIKRLKRQFGKTGNIESRDIIKRLTDDQRQVIMQIFKADPGRSNQSIADDFGVVEKTIRVLKRRFENTGNIKVRDHKKRLNGDQRRAIMQIFETDPKRSIQSIADDFGVSTFSINILKRKFKKTGTIKEGDHGNRLTDDQRQAILHIFGTDPERSNQSIAEEFGVAYSTILKLRKKFRKQAI